MRLLPKHPKRRKRLALIVLMIAGIGSAVALAAVALRQNINLFYSPSQILAGDAPRNHLFRIGGLVEKGSLKRNSNNLEIHFEVTDTVNKVPVIYTGILPDLFREGQGVVAQGKLGADGVFVASTVLAKHDENYMPPEAAQAISDAQKLKLQSTMTGN
ncbi:MAG TPA: cytochrome c maturation protein CcmE [Gammaproteobacteria bacterium]|nr:cytochrome c maturation protein CcmE [Gammaproteobacteria bacterium]